MSRVVKMVISAIFVLSAAGAVFAMEITVWQKDSVKKSAEEFLSAIRDQDWEKVVSLTVVSTDQADPETLKRMSLSADTPHDEVVRCVREFFVRVYGSSPARIGHVQNVNFPVKMDDTYALVSYKNGDLDGFNMCRVGDRWYYTLEQRRYKG